MFCSNCGNKLAEEDKFCMVCGTPRYTEDTSEEVEETAAEEMDFEDQSEAEIVTPIEEQELGEVVEEKTYEKLQEAEEFEPTPVDEPNAQRESEPFIAPTPEEPMRSKQIQQTSPAPQTTEEKLNKRGKPKKEGKKKSKGVIIGLIALIVIAVVGFFGFQYITTERAYDKAMDDGISEMLVSNYKAAEGHFKSAMDLKPNEDEASNLYNQTLLYNEAMELFEEADYEGALEKANEAVTFESNSNASKALLTKTNELIAEIEQIESDLAKVIEDQDAARALMEAGSLESALGIVNELRRNLLLDDPMYKEFKSSVKTLHEEITAKISEEAENERVRAEEERQRELAEALEAAAEAEAAAGKIDISGKSLSDYKAIDIEYARIIEMIGYPGSGTVYATKEPAGTAIVSNIADSPVFPQAVTYLTGEYTADGMIVYSSHGNGYITIYPVPSHWHQDDQSEEGYRKYAQEILDSAIDVYVEVGDEAKIISRLERTTFVK